MILGKLFLVVIIVEFRLNLVTCGRIQSVNIINKPKKNEVFQTLNGKKLNLKNNNNIIRSLKHIVRATDLASDKPKLKFIKPFSKNKIKDKSKKLYMNHYVNQLTKTTPQAKSLLLKKRKNYKRNTKFINDFELLNTYDNIDKPRSGEELRTNYFNWPFYEDSLEDIYDNNDYYIREKKDTEDEPEFFIYKGDIKQPQFLEDLNLHELDKSNPQFIVNLTNKQLPWNLTEFLQTLNGNITSNQVKQLFFNLTNKNCQNDLTKYVRDLSKSVDPLKILNLNEQPLTTTGKMDMKQIGLDGTVLSDTQVICNPDKSSIIIESLAPKSIQHIDRHIIEEIIQVDVPMRTVISNTCSTKTSCASTFYTCATTSAPCNTTMMTAETSNNNCSVGTIAATIAATTECINGSDLVSLFPTIRIKNNKMN